VAYAGLTGRDPITARGVLQLLVEEPGRALAKARRLLADYREASVRAELQAAVTLFGGGGIQSRVVLATVER
jgi:hypothetical protein